MDRGKNTHVWHYTLNRKNIRSDSRKSIYSDPLNLKITLTEIFHYPHKLNIYNFNMLQASGFKNIGAKILRVRENFITVMRTKRDTKITVSTKCYKNSYIK